MCLVNSAPESLCFAINWFNFFVDDWGIGRRRRQYVGLKLHKGCSFLLLDLNYLLSPHLRVELHRERRTSVGTLSIG